MKKRHILLFITFFLFSCSQSKIVPDFFDEYSIDRKLSGNEAKEFVNKLHFNPVTKVENEVGFYSSGKKKMIVYATFYQDSRTAMSDYKRMITKISPANSVFHQSSRFKLKDYEVYKTFGMGQSHYVFVSGNVLIWLTTETIGGDILMEKYLDYLG